MPQKNPNAIALGKLAKGIKKTLTPAALKQRREAAKRPRPGRRKKTSK